MQKRWAVGRLRAVLIVEFGKLVFLEGLTVGGMEAFRGVVWPCGVGFTSRRTAHQPPENGKGGTNALYLSMTALRNRWRKPLR